MRRDQLRDHWNQFKEEAGSIWAELTDDDLRYIRGDSERLIERLQWRYSYDRPVAEDEVRRFLARYPGIPLTISDQSELRGQA